jgi:uncharacterized protein YbaR (Trm112 family)
VCLDDGTRLKVLQRTREPRESPTLICPACDKRFKLTDQGVVEVG